MKSNVTFNKSLFRQFGGSTKSISSSMMVCHPLSKGRYVGTVYFNNAEAGDFVIDCGAEGNPQADVDMSKYIGIDGKHCDCKSDEKLFQIIDGGYAVFFSSKGESGFHVELKSEESKYSTRKLEKGDVVISLLLRPGTYEATGSNKQKTNITVVEPKNSEDYQQILSTPQTLILSENGFNTSSVKLAPGQGLVINVDGDSFVDVKLLKATPTPTPELSKSHRWIKPLKPVFKKKQKTKGKKK